MARIEDPVRERIVAAALRAIGESGTAGLRVVAVAHEAGVSQGMIRYYFGDRQGLVDEALARRFSARFGEFMGVFAERTKGCSTPAEFRSVIQAVLKEVFVPARSSMRLERNSDLGEAVARPALAAKIAAEREKSLGELRDIVADAQARGLMRADLDPAAVAGLHLAMVHGCSLFELGASSVDVDVLRQVYLEALFALIS
jgi:AcrR family transcriptional regulator